MNPIKATIVKLTEDRVAALRECQVKLGQVAIPALPTIPFARAMNALENSITSPHVASSDYQQFLENAEEEMAILKGHAQRLNVNLI